MEKLEKTLKNTSKALKEAPENREVLETISMTEKGKVLIVKVMNLMTVEEVDEVWEAVNCMEALKAAILSIAMKEIDILPKQDL